MNDHVHETFRLILNSSLLCGNDELVASNEAGKDDRTFQEILIQDFGVEIEISKEKTE